VKTGPVTESAQTALHGAITDLLKMKEGMPPLLRRIQPPALQARGTLLEAVIPLRELAPFFAELRAGSTERFDRLRFLLFDPRGRPLGTVGFRREGEEYRWLHLAEGGAEPIVEGLRVAEEFEDASGQQLEARLLVIPDLFHRALVLISEDLEAAAGPLFVPLAPHYGLDEARAAPMTEHRFEGLLRRILATLPERVEGEPDAPDEEPPA